MRHLHRFVTGMVLGRCLWPLSAFHLLATNIIFQPIPTKMLNREHLDTRFPIQVDKVCVLQALQLVLLLVLSLKNSRVAQSEA